MSEKLGIAYIGFGDHCQQSHANYLNIPSCEVVGVADLDGRRLAWGRVIPNVADDALFTTDYHELLASSRVDAVVVTTGDATHFSISQDAINAGKDVLVEKPATATIEELAALPGLFAAARARKRKLWVCHPREFGEGPWSEAAKLIGDPQQISETFGTGPMGKLMELRHDCHYTVPGKDGLHTSFADDKMNHNIVSVLRALSTTVGFRNATILDNSPTSYDARLVTIPSRPHEEGVTVRLSGRRSAHREHHEGGVYRDWVEAIFEEGVLRIEPSLGRIALTYGKKEMEPVTFDPNTLYDNMFGTFNTEFVECVRDPLRPDPLSSRTLILGTAAAILMQQPDFNGLVTEDAVRQLTPRKRFDTLPRL